MVIQHRCVPLYVVRRGHAKEARHGGRLDVKHAPAPGGTANGHAIVHLPRVVGHALPGESLDRTTPAGGTLRSSVYDTEAVVPMPMARKAASAVGQRDEHAR